MADYRLHAKIIKRSEGKSVVAAAAYRAGERILDERTGTVKDYTRKRGIMDTLILTPNNVPEWIENRARLWNGVEHREDKSTRRREAQLARELELSLPHELTHGQRIELVCDFIKKEFVEHGVVADIAFHAPPRRGDERNYHAHVLLTLRRIGPEGFGKKIRLWEQQEGTGKRKSWQQFEQERLVEWRRLWAVYENRALAHFGHPERVDHRSLEEQRIDREPTTHIGPDANEMERRGITTDRGDQNRRIKATNDNLALAKKELAGSEQRLAELRNQLAAEQMEQIRKTVRAADAVWEKVEQAGTPGPDAPPEPPQGEPPSAAQPLQPQAPPTYSEGSTPPTTGGGRAAPMPDDLSEHHDDSAVKQEAERVKQAEDAEQARQQQAAADQEKATEAAKQHEQSQAQARQEEENRLQQTRDAENRRVEAEAKQNAERQTAQAEEMRLAQQRIDAQQAQINAWHAERNRIAQEEKRREEAERQARLAEKAKEGPINDASQRYAQALGQHYDIRDPYATLAKSAMAEYAAFMRDRAGYDRDIAKTADPIERQRLDLRKRIEGAEYLALTGDRIAVQSEIITGRLNTDEAKTQRKRATEYRIQAHDLRQQLRELSPERAPEKDREREPSEPKPEPARARRPRTRGPDRYDEVIKQQDELARKKEREREKDQSPEPPDPERQKQQERERELQRKRDRER